MPWVAKIDVFGLFFRLFHKGLKRVFLGLFFDFFIVHLLFINFFVFPLDC